MSEIKVATAYDEALLMGSTEEFELAIKRGDAITFPQVMKLLYCNIWPQREDRALLDRYRELYCQALTQFMDSCGGIRESFYANEFVAGALLTHKDDLFFNIWWDSFKFDTIPARALEAVINDLRLKVKLYLSKTHARICTERLFRLYKSLISILRVEYYRWSGVDLKGKTEPSTGHLEDLKQVRRELESVQATYRRVGLARGQTYYVAAAALGIVVIVAIAIAAIPKGPNPGVWLGAVVGGAVGALLSVLERLTRGALRVGFETGYGAMIMSGISRPVVGALSGLALFVLVKGNIVPLIKVPEMDQGLFFAGVALLAGFSERLLKDVLGNASSSLTKERAEASTAKGVAEESAENAPRHQDEKIGA